MKYNLDYFLEIIKKNRLNTIADLRRQFRHLHTYYFRHKAQIGPLPLTQSKRANNTLTKDVCASLALKYSYKSDFQKKDKGAYSKALREGWLKEICAHMGPKPFIAKGGKPGSLAANSIDLLGQKFGNWTVVSKAQKVQGYKDLFWTCICICGTESVIRGQNLRNGSSTKCTKCSNQISKPMLELAAYIKSLGVDVEIAYRTFGFEIDLYVHSHNFFIEYDGLIWHSSKFRATASTEKARFHKFKQAGLTGMRIFEDQYLQSPELIKQMISNRLGFKPAATVDGCTLEIISTPSKYRHFCNQYHLDGYGRSSWAVVAKRDNEILAFMGFRPYMAGQFKGQPELSRFCTNYNFNCYGLFGKMLKLAKKHIKENNLGTHVVSASDNHISQGKVYANNGFKQHGGDSNNWFYYLHSKGLRLHRTAGKKLKPPKITAQEYAQNPTETLQASSGLIALKKWGKSEPLYKIYGWGQKLWVLSI